MPTGLKEPKTTRGCPKQQPNQTEEQYKEEVKAWVLENSEEGAGGCWNWKGAYSPLAGGARYNNFAAHAFVYRGLIGEYLGNLLRVCKNRKCVNPDHCHPAVGERTKRKQEIKEIVERGEVVLKEEGRTQVVEGITGEVSVQVERVVEKAVKKLERELVDGVVAKLIEVRFDELVANGVVKKLRG